MKLLFATSELFPLIKTGGLGDVAHSLPNALTELEVDVHVVLPAYREVLSRIDHIRVLGWLPLSGGREVRILEAEHPEFSAPLWLVDAPTLFDRPGSPYTNPEGQDWPDNAQRFALFSEAAAQLALDRLDLGWRADVVHANDWQTGLVPAFLTLDKTPPRSLFTVHNLAYDCQVDFGTFQSLHLPTHWWSMEYGEFYGRLSMLKMGLVFSKLITTVSPRYAEEIRTVEYGYGYAPILDAHADKLVGILNGIDDDIWNPRSDPLLAARYHADGKIRAAKRANREALLRALDAPEAAIRQTGALIGSVGRLVHQKGIDLLLDAIPALLAGSDSQFVLIGAGEPKLERQLKDLADSHPERVFCFIGYSETFAHQLEAGCDIFVMPSRYEPCGLNQMYSLRYGTPPVVRATGGLADTVEDTTPRSIARGEANGFVFVEPSSAALQEALERALEVFEKPKQWLKLIKTGMRGDYSWRRSAESYLQLYRPD
ncbi:MAG: glycogen synthase GlgA [Chromatiaceae bacterium]|jgi:starch synthase|nr:glycogen synthase GlgA [Chromatiaceae bacterium]